MTAREIAQYFVSLVDEDAGDSISNLKVQKLLYYAQGFYLALHDEPLFPEAIKAWLRGPVIPEVFYAYQSLGAGPIPIEKVNLDLYAADLREFLDEVNEVYGQFTSAKLGAMTRLEPPWRDAVQGETISQQSLKEFFSTLVTLNDEVGQAAA